MDSTVWSKLIEATPFGAICVICLVFVIRFSNKQISMLKEAFQTSLKEIRNAYTKNSNNPKK